MLESVYTKEFNSPFANQSRSVLGEKLAELQRECIEEDISVIIMVDGWESSGKGLVINNLARVLDARASRVAVFEEYSKEKDYLYTYQFWKHKPAMGDFGIFDRSMYYHLFNRLDLSDEEQQKWIRHIKNLEQTLYDDEIILIKFFLHQTKEQQKIIIDTHQWDPYRDILVSKKDIMQNKKYDEYLRHFDDVLKKTDSEIAPWQIVPSANRKLASKHIMGTSAEIIKEEIKRIMKRREEEKQYKHQPVKIEKSIEDFDLSSTISEEDYRNVIDELKDRAGALAFALAKANIPTVMVFEGMDAAGKGGAIRRLIDQMDARLYDINPTSAPSDLEKDHHYLWRFYNNFPRDGHIAIFDRSWYGRVMVERVEGFATEAEWSRAYTEIRNMEEELYDDGMLLLKFFLVISKDEQKRRFEARQINKPYKITDEDWRNREKWDVYVEAIDEMIAQTSTEIAPWTVVSSEDKKHARVKVLETFIREAEKILEKTEDEIYL
ncbi:MAG: hypothetical protein ACOX3H_04010 [Saccharofermentanales bacterium]|jgi:polyphosphate:AMP phosphotransferase